MTEEVELKIVSIPPPEFKPGIEVTANGVITRKIMTRDEFNQMYGEKK